MRLCPGPPPPQSSTQGQAAGNVMVGLAPRPRRRRTNPTMLAIVILSSVLFTTFLLSRLKHRPEGFFPGTQPVVTVAASATSAPSRSAFPAAHAPDRAPAPTMPVSPRGADCESVTIM